MRIGMVANQYAEKDNRAPLWWLRRDSEIQHGPILTLVKTEASARSGAKENAFANAKGA